MNTIAIIHPHPDYFALLRGPWTIRTVYHKHNPPVLPKSYQLLHLGKRQRSIPALPGNAFITPELGRMVRECCHLNRINAKPRRRIECAADAPNPDKYISAGKYLTPVSTKRPKSANA